MAKCLSIDVERYLAEVCEINAISWHSPSKYSAARSDVEGIEEVRPRKR
jgi:hypothetical protein